MESSAFASNCPQPGHSGDITQKEADAGILPSHGITLDVTDADTVPRPPVIHHLSLPAYQSPLRHHRRSASEHRVVKETLNAESKYTNNEEDGKAEHHINQYIIKDEIGRGSFGAVHLAVDQYGQEFAVKEFSKSRLRKRAQSNILRRPRHTRRPGQIAAGSGLNAPLHRHTVNDVHNAEENGNPLYLIKEEIAIMKKLNHPNLVSLIEVLDDPEEDSLYMVLEMCKKGVVMKVGLGEVSDPYDPEKCRHWFRDLILGIEYLHAQGVVHRDIKPDNLLLTDDDVLKIVDFGVSEMFAKQSEMLTAKSAGSPAFLPPELCVTKHGDISGRAADIWSMGISLYCLRFGKIPFEHTGVLELYEAIKSEDICLPADHDPSFCDLLTRLLEKDPSKRIKMDEIREHPWVTKNGTDPLLSREENTAELVEPPSQLEVNHAITVKMKHLITLMKAVRKFKNTIEKKRRPAGIQATLVKEKHMLHRPAESGVKEAPPLLQSKSDDTYDRRSVEGILVTEGIHHDHSADPLPRTLNSREPLVASPEAQEARAEKGPSLKNTQAGAPPNDQSYFDPPAHLGKEDSGDKGHAHDPLDEEPLFLGIGTGAQTQDPLESLTPPAQNSIAESPSAAEFSIYDTAYEEEVKRIRAAQGQEARVYLTRRVDKKKSYKADENMVDAPSDADVKGSPREGLKVFLEKAREKGEKGELRKAVENVEKTLAKEKRGEELSVKDKGNEQDKTKETQSHRERFNDVALRAKDKTRALGMEWSDRSQARLNRTKEDNSKDATVGTPSAAVESKDTSTATGTPTPSTTDSPPATDVEKQKAEVHERHSHRFIESMNRAKDRTRAMGMEWSTRSGDRMDGGMKRAVERRWNINDE